MKGLTLLIDADDTLWENNIYFEEVVLGFCALVEARGHARELARQTLNQIERVRTKTSGYGIRNFHASLRQACSELLGPAEHERELALLADLCDGLVRQRPVMIDGVEETLAYLSGRHRLILFTKGDLDDQQVKLQRSGVRRYLHQVDVVREKDTEAYHDAIARHGIRPEKAWMIGNSPKSDILPALAAGLGAVFIPHHATWELELEEMVYGPESRFLALEKFAELERYF